MMVEGEGSSDRLPPPGVPVTDRFGSRHTRKRSPWRWVVITGIVLTGFVFILVWMNILISGSPTVIPIKHVGVVEITGMILDSKDPVETIEEFAEQHSVAVILLRINSPGGMIVPSQEIYQAVLRARKQKKVIASLGSVAASGGYYIASAADTIISNPGTITGSIGVIMNFLNYGELQEWAKLKSYNLKTGTFKDMGSPTRMVTEEERQLFQSILTNMLDQFIDDIAKGRGDRIEAEEIRRLADGRIFTGTQAKELHLVDEIGSFQEAVEFAGKVSGLGQNPKLVYPKKSRDSVLGLLLEGAVEKILFKVLGVSSLSSPMPNFFYALPN